MNSMFNIKRVISIAKADFLSITKNPSTIIFNLLFPIIFILVLGYMSNMPNKFYVSFTPKSSKTELYKKIEKNLNFEIITDTENELLKKLKQGKIISYIDVIDNETINIKKSNNRKEEFFLFENIIKNIIYNLDTSQKINTKYIVKIETIDSKIYNKIDFLLPGMLGFSILSFALFGVAFSFFHLRQKMVFKRIFCTPVFKIEIILGQLTSRITFQILNSTLLILIGYYFFNFTLTNGFITFMQLLIISILGMATFMSYGFIISGISKTEAVIPALTNIISLPQWLLGGVFFSTEYFPKWLKTISSFLPLTNLNDAMRKISFDGNSLYAIKKEILIITIWLILGLILSKRFFRWEP